MATRVSTMDVELKALRDGVRELHGDLREMSKDVQGLRVDMLARITEVRRINPTAYIGAVAVALTASGLVGGIIASCIWLRVGVAEARCDERHEAIQRHEAAQQAQIDGLIDAQARTAATTKRRTPATGTTKP